MIKKLLKYTYILDVVSTPGLVIDGRVLYSDRASERTDKKNDE